MEEFKDITLYDWVPFFHELCSNIAVIGGNKTTRNEALREKAKLIFGDTHPIFTNPVIDPLSFIYSLAQKNTINQKQSTFNLVKNAFNLASEIPTDWYFPTPTPNTKSLFYAKGIYITSEGEIVDTEILWRFFIDAVETGNISENDFFKILSIKNVGITKLTQSMFLINPIKFLSIDEPTSWLPILNKNLKENKGDIYERGLTAYNEYLNKYVSACPECHFYEINLLAYLLSRSTGAIHVSETFCQVSSWIYGQKDDDYFDEFLENNAIRTGGAESTSGKFKYRLSDVRDGDIVLVRRGTKNLGGIGIIIHNEYLDGGYTDDKKIKILWLNKKNKILDNALGDMSGFNIATNKTKNSFNGLYSETFQLIEKIITKQNFKNASNKIFNNSNMDKNLILYGPPGTGKTYSTIGKSIKIVNPDYIFPVEGTKEEIRKKIKNEFEKLQNDHRIFVCTFHQSLSYEDFIEGIKPKLNNDTEGTLSYFRQSGVFKKACAYAAYSCYKASKMIEPEETNYFFDELYEAFIVHLSAELKKEPPEPPEFDSITGKKITVKKINSNDSIIANSKETKSTKDPAPLTKENFQKMYDKFESIEEITSLQDIRDTIQIQPRTTEFYALFGGLKEFEKTVTPQQLDETEVDKLEYLDESEIIKKYESGVFTDSVSSHGNVAGSVVLIIDEINRGNIAAIFGELITLIESDKRWGAKEQMKITLPYSQIDFFIPVNLHVIGTMNTADRSVEALDTALRRRFSFEFMPPLRDEVPENIEEIEFRKIFIAINESIAYLLDEDHRIGHSYFMDITTKALLKEAFKNKIIPLLTEYFYNDFGKIRLVLGDGFVKKNEGPGAKPKFAADDSDFILEKTVFEIIQIDEAFDIALALNKII